MDYTRRYENRHYSMGSNIFAVLQDKEVVMRLIDADVLKANCDIKVGNTTIGRRDYVMFHEIDSAPTIETKQIKYFDEEEKVWKIGSVIVNE